MCRKGQHVGAGKSTARKRHRAGEQVNSEECRDGEGALADREWIGKDEDGDG